MPFLDAALDPVTDSDKTAHACKWVALSNAEDTRQLRVCTGAWAEWNGTNPKEGLRYCDMAAWTLEVAMIAQDVDGEAWPLTFYGMQALEPPFLLAFEHLEKRKYACEATFVTALIAAAAKVDRGKLAAASLDQAGLVGVDGIANLSQQTTNKEDAVTWGKLRRSGAGGRAAAWLERVTVADRHNTKTVPALRLIFDVATDRGRIRANEPDDEAWAYTLVHELSNRIVTPPAFLDYRDAGGDRWLDAQARARDGGDQFDGTSAFCQEHTPGMMAVCCPVVADVLCGLVDARTINSSLLELASVFPKDTVPTTPADLFTVHGMKALGRQTAPYAVWAYDAKTSVASVDVRSASFINRVRLNSSVGYAPAGGGPGGGGEAGGGGAAAGGAAGTLRASGEAWRQSLTRVRELDTNPALIGDLIRVVNKAGHNPLDMLAIALTGKTSQAPTRASTPLTRMLGTGKINASVLDARLAPLHEYAEAYGGRYLGRVVGDVLVKLHLADDEAVSDLRFDGLWDVLSGKHDPKSWEITLDFYNLLIMELVRQVQCEGTLFDIAVTAVPREAVYTDVLINGRLPILVSAIFEAMGLPHLGDSSFKSILETSNAFVSFNGGVTSESTQGARGVITPPRPGHTRARAVPARHDASTFPPPSAHGTYAVATPAPRSRSPRRTAHGRRRTVTNGA